MCSSDLIESDNKLQEQSTKHQNDLQELLDRQADQLDTTKRKAEIDANMTVLALQQEHQAKIQTLQDKHNAEVEQYQAKYRELLEQMEQKKTTKPKTKTTKAQQDKINESK